MALATWWRGDELPPLSLIPGFRVEKSNDEELIARINLLPQDAVRQRIHTAHQPYIAFMGETPAGYGWIATREASIGELGLHFALPKSECYLWDFATLPEWQGYGIYPRLLQHMLRQLSPTVKRAWIIHAPENSPSGVGITKAGLLPVGQLSFRSDGKVGLAPFDALERAQAGATLLGIPLIESVLAPCWHCGGTALTRPSTVDIAGCWPPLQATTQPCTCAIELKPAKQLIVSPVRKSL